jgi:hypothetical protein
MLPALNIPGLVSPPCPSLPHTFPSAPAKQRHKGYHLPPGICLTISCPLQFRFPFPFRFTFPSFVPFAFLVPMSQPCVSSSHSPSSLLLSLAAQLLPLLGPLGSTMFASSSCSSINSTQFSCLTARKSPGVYCPQLGAYIIPLISLLQCQEKRSQVRLTFPDLVVCTLESSAKVQVN